MQQENKITIYIKTKYGVYPIKLSGNGYKTFECNINGEDYNIFEGSEYWEQNYVNMSSDLIELADALIIKEPGHTPQPYPWKVKSYFEDPSWFNSFIRRIKEDGTKIYLGIWTAEGDLIRFAQLTEDGTIKYVGGNN